jgi:hypothetical protein
MLKVARTVAAPPELASSLRRFVASSLRRFASSLCHPMTLRKKEIFRFEPI